MTQLESLANELLLEIFEYLDTTDLLRAVNKLNSRFDQLLSQCFQFHQFNFQFLSKENFDHIVQSHLPSLIEQITSLHLSNDETPYLCEMFLSSNLTLDRFLRLRALSLYDVHSLQTLDRIIYQCRTLPHFTHLRIMKRNETKVHSNIIDLLNNIWRLPKLIYCNLNGIIHTDETSLSNMFVISSTIEHLFIENIQCNLTGLSHLLECTPNLQRFSATLYSYSQHDQCTSIANKMTEIRFCFGGSLKALEALLTTFPRLTRLKLITSQVFLDGYMWKKLIMHSLPNIQILQLKMELNFQQRFDDIEEIVDELLESFRTSFWIEEHHWYIRCHWNPSDPYKSITLYTLPYAFRSYDFVDKSSVKSTCSDERQYWSYNRVHTFIQGTINDVIHRLARFSHVHQLQLNLPVDNLFWSQFSPCHHLSSLHITLYQSSAYRQLQKLLDLSPCLYSLKIESYIGFPTRVFEMTSESIRRLDLIDILANQPMYFDQDACLILANSSLGIQCEVLLISIKSRTMIFDLINRMIHLRLLIFECADDDGSYCTYASSSNEFIEWLHAHVSTANTVTIDPSKHSRIQIWIRREPKNSNLPKETNRLFPSLTWLRQFFAERFLS